MNWLARAWRCWPARCCPTSAPPAPSRRLASENATVHGSKLTSVQQEAEPDRWPRPTSDVEWLARQGATGPEGVPAGLPPVLQGKGLIDADSQPEFRRRGGGFDGHIANVQSEDERSVSGQCSVCPE